MQKIQLEIVAISHSVSQSHNYAVILGEVEGTRRLPIVIGGFEAQAIAVAVERMTPNRPLTHDLFKAALDQFNVRVKEVVINDLLDGIFYAQLICEHQGEIYVIDSRTSDAIAMAVRYHCPIYTFDFILNQSGVELELEGEPASPEKKSGKQKNELSSMSIPDLEELLAKVLEKEDYERAATIRDEVKKRKSLND